MAIKIKRIFSITIIVAAALSERKNVETYLTIVNEKLLSLWNDGRIAAVCTIIRDKYVMNVTIDMCSTTKITRAVSN